MMNALKPVRSLPSQERYTFPKSLRLLKRVDFVNLKSSKERLHTAHFILVTKGNALGYSRLGVAVSRKTGKAVKRNRIKRLLREYFRLNRSIFPHDYDTLVIAKKDAGSLNLRLLEQEMNKLFGKKSG
ncbi:MAG: ribonuclease P protein component [Desulfobacteraceae bacterium]|nr:MAG: ribonuclease P protein component [Desulfobacteraceae bacterium]